MLDDDAKFYHGAVNIGWNQNTSISRCGKLKKRNGLYTDAVPELRGVDKILGRIRPRTGEISIFGGHYEFERPTGHVGAVVPCSDEPVPKNGPI